MNFTSSRRLLVATAALAAAGGAGAAVAHATTSPQASAIPATTTTAPGAPAPAAPPAPTVTAAGQARTSATTAGRLSAAKAALIAERQGHGRAAEIDAETEDFGPTYDVKVIRPGGIEVDILVDANTGRVLRAVVDSDDRADPEDRPAGSLTAATAALIAERQAHGLATKIKAETKDIGPTYEVKVTRPGGSEVDVIVDGNTGRVLRAVLDTDQ